MLADWLNVYDLPGARREVCLEQIARRAEARGWPELAALCHEGVAREQAARELERSWRAGRRRRGDPRLRALDAQIDKAIGGLYRLLGEAAELLAGEDLGRRAAAARAELFPGGAAAPTRMARPDQAAWVADLLARLGPGGSHADLADDLGLRALVTRLEVLGDELQALLRAPAPDHATWDDVSAARSAGHEHLLRVIVQVLARHDTASPHDLAAREDLLAPVRHHQAELRETYRRRQRQGPPPRD